MLVVIYAVHKRVTTDVGALATLVSKSNKHFLILLLAKSYDIFVSKNEEVIYFLFFEKRSYLLIVTPYGLICVFVTCLHAIIKK